MFIKLQLPARELNKYSSVKYSEYSAQPYRYVPHVLQLDPTHSDPTPFLTLELCGRVTAERIGRNGDRVNNVNGHIASTSDSSKKWQSNARIHCAVGMRALPTANIRLRNVGLITQDQIRRSGSPARCG